MSKVALVTGGTRGIGREISVMLKELGCKVAANYASNHDVAKNFTDETGIPAYSWNVARYEECQEGIAQIEKDLGGSIDILINNAGITRDTTLHKMDLSHWNDVISTNLSAVYNLCREVIGPMRDKKFGRIVTISSINGQKGQIGQCNYAAAKSGVIGFSKAVALENASKGITVNVIAPGYINTEMVQAVPGAILDKIVSQIPVGRLGEPSEVARCVAFMVSEEASFITGSTLTINGGQIMI